MAFVKGKSGNPSGRPHKAEQATEYIRKHISDLNLAALIVNGAKTGDFNMIKLAAEYMWGKPVQRNEVSGDLTLNLAEKLREACGRSGIPE